MTAALRPAPTRSPRRSLPGPRRVAWLERLSVPSAWGVTIALSVAIGLVAVNSSTFASLHALVVLVVVVAVASFARGPAPVLAVTLYAGVCDVFWRAMGARVPWEAAKYAFILGTLAIVVRFVRRPRHAGLVATMFLLLVPGAVLSVAELGLSTAREAVSANLSGLVAVGAGILACSSLRLSPRELRGIYLVVLSPIVSLTAAATLGTIRAGSITWTDEANLAASAGFGPNQVSSIMALGALLCALVLLRGDAPWRLRAIALATGVWIVGQMVLTFSRGGVFGLVLALAAIALVALFTSGQRTRTVVAAGVVMVLGIQIMSWAGAFTGGASEARFSSTDTTNRWPIAKGDLELFATHPILGVGAGRSKYLRSIHEAAHTEYTRLLGEHGLLGVGVLVVLAVLCVRLIRDGRGWYRMASAGLIVLALGQMAHSATRIGSIAVAFGLASLREDR